VLSQKKNREKKIQGFLSVWFLAIICVAGVIVYSVSFQSLGRDISKAVNYFNKAGNYIKQGNYSEAVYFCEKGIKKAPKFSLGYTLLGSTYRLWYENENDNTIKEKEIEAFKTAEIFQEKPEGRCKMDKTAVFFGILFLILLAGVCSIIILILYNILVRREENVNESWGQINVLCQRKLDLVPALLEVVKDYAQHEAQTQQAVINARSKAQSVIEGVENLAGFSKKQIEDLNDSQMRVSLGLNKIFALAEKYPDLKANTNFLTMQEQLKETEDSIANIRNAYNQHVRAYNSSLRYFPFNIIAALFKFKAKDYFKGGEKSTNE